MKCKIPYYTSNLIFGDDLEHRFIPSDYKLSPFKVTINSTTTIPEGYTALQSVWLWRYYFSSANNTNFWSSNSQYGANGSSIPSGVSTGTTYLCNSSSLIPEAYITTGTSTIEKTQLSQIRLSSYNDWYFNSMPSYPSSTINRGIILRFSDNRLWDLPSDLYTINGTTITWTTSHPLMILLSGCECTLV